MAGQNETVNVLIASGDFGAFITIPPAKLKSIAGYIVAMTIFCPTMAETPSLWISPDFVDDLTTMASEGYEDTTDVITPGSYVSFTPPPCKTMAIILDGFAADDRLIKVTFQYDMAT